MPTRWCERSGQHAGGTFGCADELATAAAASKEQTLAIEAVQDVDRCITELAAALPVDLMPGADDLSNHALPQQPMHRCLFPGAAPYESLHRVTNPYRFTADGVSFLGTSGQNVADVLQCAPPRFDLPLHASMPDSATEVMAPPTCVAAETSECTQVHGRAGCAERAA